MGRKRKEKSTPVKLDGMTEKYISANCILENIQLASQFAEFVKERKETGIDYSKDIMMYEIDRWPLR